MKTDDNYVRKRPSYGLTANGTFSTFMRELTSITMRYSMFFIDYYTWMFSVCQ